MSNKEMVSTRRVKYSRLALGLALFETGYPRGPVWAECNLAAGRPRARTQTDPLPVHLFTETRRSELKLPQERVKLGQSLPELTERGIARSGQATGYKNTRGRMGHRIPEKRGMRGKVARSSHGIVRIRTPQRLRLCRFFNVMLMKYALIC